jgi:hypothetical protein
MAWFECVFAILSYAFGYLRLLNSLSFPSRFLSLSQSLIAAHPKPSVASADDRRADALLASHATASEVQRARELARMRSDAAAVAAKMGNPGLAFVSDNNKNLPNLLPTHTVRATLIMCPNTLIAQWETEIREKFPNANLRVGVHYQNRRVPSVQKLDDYDVVCVLAVYGFCNFVSRGAITPLHYSLLRCCSVHYC